jgi:hypothetical protein
MKNKKKHLGNLVKIAVAGALIYWLWSSGKLDFSALVSSLSPQWAVLGLGLVGLNIFVCSERWRILLKLQDRHINLWPAFKLSLMGIFFNYAMPGGVGGDAVKAFYFHKDHPNSKVIAVTSVIIDRVIGLYAMILMALFIMIYDINHVMRIKELTSLFYGIIALSTVATLGLFLLFSKSLYSSGFMNRLIKRLPWSERIQKLYDSFHMYGKSLQTLVAVILISFLAQTVTVGYLFLVGQLSGSDARWSTYFMVAPLGFIAMGLPISPAGIGVGQAAFYYLFNIYLEKRTSLGPSVVTAFQATQLIWGLLGAVFYLRRKDKVQENFEESVLA